MEALGDDTFSKLADALELNEVMNVKCISPKKNTIAENEASTGLDYQSSTDLKLQDKEKMNEELKKSAHDHVAKSNRDKMHNDTFHSKY